MITAASGERRPAAIIDAADNSAFILQRVTLRMILQQKMLQLRVVALDGASADGLGAVRRVMPARERERQRHLSR